MSRTFRATAPDRYGRAELHATVHVHDPRFHTAIVGGGSSGIGEAYLQGWLDVDDLTAFLRLLGRERSGASTRRGCACTTWWDRSPTACAGCGPPASAATVRNIPAHYDLGNDFFELLLDETMMYSAASSTRPDTPLADGPTAQARPPVPPARPRPRRPRRRDRHRLGRLRRARRDPLRRAVVTTTTFGRTSTSTPPPRVAAAGLADRVEVRDDDYRDLTGTYDTLVSDRDDRGGRLARARHLLRPRAGRLLEPDGAVGLQAIVIPAPRYERAKITADFIKTPVFPGGCLPSVEAILRGRGGAPT